MAATQQKPGKKASINYFLWWRTDPEEIEPQVAQYHTLSVWKSARGNSMLLCMLTVAVTVLAGRFLKQSGSTILIEAVVWSVLGLLMYRGQRWAFLAGMVLWTLEKAFLLVDVSGSGRTPIAQVIWWAIYMHTFLLAYRVEGARAQKRKAPPVRVNPRGVVGRPTPTA